MGSDHTVARGRLLHRRDRADAGEVEGDLPDEGDEEGEDDRGDRAPEEAEAEDELRLRSPLVEPEDVGDDPDERDRREPDEGEEPGPELEAAGEPAVRT